MSRCSPTSRAWDITKLLPMPEIDSTQFPHARKYIDQGFHRIVYRFSPDDYKQISEIWNGSQVNTGDEREVIDGLPEGGKVPDLTPIPPMYAPASTPRTSRRSLRGLATSKPNNRYSLGPAVGRRICRRPCSLRRT